MNSKLSNKANNKFRVSFTDVVDDRGPKGSPFPNVSISSYDGGPTIAFGTEPASSANLLKQRIINFYDAFKFYKGNHAISVGADIDFNKSYNLFHEQGLQSLYLCRPGPGWSKPDQPAHRIHGRSWSFTPQRGYSLRDDNSKGGDDAVNAAANFKSVRLVSSSMMILK